MAIINPTTINLPPQFDTHPNDYILRIKKGSEPKTYIVTAEHTSVWTWIKSHILLPIYCFFNKGVPNPYKLEVILSVLKKGAKTFESNPHDTEKLIALGKRINIMKYTNRHHSEIALGLFSELFPGFPDTKKMYEETKLEEKLPPCVHDLLAQETAIRSHLTLDPLTLPKTRLRTEIETNYLSHLDQSVKDLDDLLAKSPTLTSKSRRDAWDSLSSIARWTDSLDKFLATNKDAIVNDVGQDDIDRIKKSLASIMDSLGKAILP